jgi:hypothetical protein
MVLMATVPEGLDGPPSWHHEVDQVRAQGEA